MEEKSLLVGREVVGGGQGLRTPRPCHPGRERPRSIVLGRKEGPSLDCEQNKTKLMFSTVCAVTLKGRQSPCG